MITRLYFILPLLFSLHFTPRLVGQRVLPLVVSTQWLNDNLTDPDIVILHMAFSKKDYDYAHIPGARFLWYESLAPNTQELATEMISPEKAKVVLENLGITHKSKIIMVFNSTIVTTTTRMVLALNYYGLGDQVSWLDGGLPAWKAEGRPISKETSVVKRSSLKININPSVIRDANWIRTHLNDSTVSIIDARFKTFYDGNGGGVARQGHIKGAVNIPYPLVVDSTNHLKPISDLQKIFDSAGIRNGNTIITYCHVGNQATLIYFVARLLGYNASVYDGSFEDWNYRDDSFPVEKP